MFSCFFLIGYQTPWIFCCWGLGFGSLPWKFIELCYGRQISYLWISLILFRFLLKFFLGWVWNSHFSRASLTLLQTSESSGVSIECSQYSVRSLFSDWSEHNVSLPHVSTGNFSSCRSPIVSICLVSCIFTLHIYNLLISKRLMGPVVRFLELCLSAKLPSLFYLAPQVLAASSSSNLDFCLLSSEDHSSVCGRLESVSSRNPGLS